VRAGAPAACVILDHEADMPSLLDLDLDDPGAALGFGAPRGGLLDAGDAPRITPPDDRTVSLADAYQSMLPAQGVPDRSGALAAQIARNPIGTESVQSMGMPSAQFDPLVAISPSGQPTTASDLEALRTQLDEGSNTAQTVMGMFEGGLKLKTPAGNIVRVDMRGPGKSLLDAKPMTARAVGGLLDEHLAEGSVELRGGRGDTPDMVVTLPPGVTRPGDIAAQGQSMVDQASAMTQDIPPGMTAPRYWYRAGAGALHGSTGEDLEATQRLAAAHAITSPQTDVAGNSNIATNAWNQSLLGEPISVKTAPQNQALEETLYGGSVPESRKTGPFFENHMRYLDPAYADSMTNDIWQMRQAGYTNPDGSPYAGTPSVGEDNYVRMMVDRATRRLNADNVDGGGWTPDQVQAALWVHQKTLMETGRATPMNFNFADALERLKASQSNAHEAGPALLGPAAGDPQAQAAFRQSAPLVDASGRDIVNSSLGMLTPPNAPGAAAVAITGDGIKPSSRSLMDASTLIRATLLRQPDALWMAHPDVSGQPTIAASNVVHSFSGDPADHALQLRAALDKAGGGLDQAVLQQTPAGVRVVNIGELTGLDNPGFQARVKDAITQAGLPPDLKRARADYGYFTHDWTADPTGSGYVAALARLPPNLQRAGDQLFAQLGGRVDAASSAVSGAQSRTGPWRVPGFAQAVGPEVALPQRQWLVRPSASDPGSRLPDLLGR
jgi:hypothetical protein